MTNISQAQSLLNKAREAVKGGQAIEAARLGLAAQRVALKCRAAALSDVAFNGHSIAAFWAGKVLAAEAEQALRSEAGRIKAETAALGF